MTRSELVSRVIDEDGGLPRERASEILDVFFGTMLEHLGEGGRIEIRGFGSFHVGVSTGKNLHNPRTLERIPTRPDRRRVRFRASPMLTLGGGPIG